MSSSEYMAGRKKYGRPQALLFSDNPGTLQDGLYIPNGIEVGGYSVAGSPGIDSFLILSDDNRSQIDFSNTRIEKRERMINGRMRSYHIADKLSLSVSWDMLPSRSYGLYPNFNPDTGKSDYANNRSLEYTTDGGAGGVDLLEWYESHQGPFWVYLAYDKHSVFDSSDNKDSQYAKLAQYNQIMQMYFSDFKYSIVKRGTNTHDFWNISLSLEEV